MLTNFKQKLKRLIPPLIFDLYHSNRRKYSYFGDYKTWQDATKESTEFDVPEVIEKVKNSLLKVKNGEAICERDSVLYDEVQYSWPLISTLLHIALKNDGQLHIIDFGGSLGSTYYICKNFLSPVKSLAWSVVEQKEFIKYGKSYFEDNVLKFYADIDSALKEKKYHVLILSAVIGYIEKPYDLLSYISSKRIEYVIIDRTYMFDKNDRITIQKVHPSIYSAINPCWIFNFNSLTHFFEENYDLLAAFKVDTPVVPLEDGEAQEKGFIFKRK